MEIIYRVEFLDKDPESYTVESTEDAIDQYIHDTHPDLHGFHWHPVNDPNPEDCYMCQGITHLEWKMGQ